MGTQYPTRRTILRVSRRGLLQAGLTAGVTLSALPLSHPPALRGAEAGQPKRGGTLRVRGWDPPHFDPHVTRNFMTHSALSFVYNKLLRHKVGPDVQPGTFIVEPDLAERWETPDDTTYIFHLRQGVKWHNRGEPSPAIGRGLAQWSLRIDQLGAGAKYYQYDPKEARRLLAEAGYPKGLKTQLTVSSGYGRDLIDAVQLAQRFLKDVGMEAELKIQEYGAYQATTGQGKFDGMAMGPHAVAWEADSALYGLYAPGQPRNRGHINDPKITAMVTEQRRTKDPEARQKILVDFQRYAAEQQYYVYLFSVMITSSWQPYKYLSKSNLIF